MTIAANMTAAQIDEAVIANPALKADAVKILVERYSRKSTKGRLPRWKSVTKLAEYLGYTGEMKREPIAAFIEVTISKAPAKAPAKAKPEPKAEPVVAVAFTRDAMAKLSTNQLKMAKMMLATLKNGNAAPARRKAATTTLRKYGLLA